MAGPSGAMVLWKTRARLVVEVGGRGWVKRRESKKLGATMKEDSGKPQVSATNQAKRGEVPR